jgi:serine/threonine protein kinase
MINTIENYLKLNNYKLVEIIQVNHKKRTRLIKVEKDNQYYIVKAIAEDSPLDIKNKFLVEVEYYRNHHQEYLPNLIEWNDQLLILEFVEGKSLRETLIDNSFNSKCLALLIRDVEKLYINSKRENLNRSNFKNVFSHLSNLLQSGPIQTKDIKVSFYKRILNKLILLVLKFKLRWYISRIDKEDLKNGFMHGDLHYNNIIIAENGIVKFIDFENISYAGYFDFDIMYLFAMLEINLDNKSKELNMCREKIIDQFRDKNMMKIFQLFRFALRFNSRFKVHA